MEGDRYQWNDPLLLTDVSWQKEQSSSAVNISRDHSIHETSPSLPSSQTSTMSDDPNSCRRPADADESWRNGSVDVSSVGNFGDPIANSAVDGRSMLGFSLSSPDLVVCAGSPDIPGDFQDFFKNGYQNNVVSSVELSLEEGINGCEVGTSKKTSAENIPSSWEASKGNQFLEASFELVLPPRTEEKSDNDLPIVCINVGSMEQATVFSGMNFLEDSFFTGGDTVRTDALIGVEECLPLYQTARFGNFSYHFSSLNRGSYLIDLHLAEIVFTDGPPGLRVFDVYIQEKKAASNVDIYARVGANSPLLISNLKASVDGDEGLHIEFVGVTGTPVVCGITIRTDSSGSFRKDKSVDAWAMPKCDLPNSGSDSVIEELQNLQRDYELQKRELTEARQALEELRWENAAKSKECQEACNSLKDLQNELMRKSMHVGSLAFAIEGQVKEKSKWFSTLRDLKRKLKILKMEQISLSEEAVAYKSFLNYMNEMSSTIQSKMKQQEDQYDDLKFKFMDGAKERKELYNQVLELKGNIRVFCRCRPLNNEEINAGVSMAIDFDSAKDGELTVKANGTSKKTFKFDAVFGPRADQVDVFEDTAPFATSVLDGFNVCIFAYGQTGTGKTFTMEGTDEARGVNFRTLLELFRIIKEREQLFRYEISVSVLEVYNEQIRDLLVPVYQPGVAAKRLEVKQVGEGIRHVPGLVEAHVTNISEVWEVLQSGSNARSVGSTNANEHSSRSHCIHCVMVKGENLLNGECTRSKLWLVDLAGSERIAKTEVQGERLKETQNINRSLSALGDVISALATKSPHIPFRNSKLTHLLQDSLGGDSKALMLVQISPNENDLSETLCSLNFASRVRGVELGPAKKQVDGTELLRFKQLFEKSKQDIKSKDQQIKKMEETIHSLDLKMKERDLKNKNLQDKVKELEAQLSTERKQAQQQVDVKKTEQHQQQQQTKPQQEDQNTIVRPPLASRPLEASKNFNEYANITIGKDQSNSNRPLPEFKSLKPVMPLPQVEGVAKCIDPTEKENNPEMVEHLPLPKRMGRASICPIARRIPAIPAPVPRRSSLIPFPGAPSLVKFPPPAHLPAHLPAPLQVPDVKEDVDGSQEVSGLPEQTPTESPKGLKSGRKLSSILRRSLHKKMYLKSPLQPHVRKGGINVGMEKVRVSIGGRGRVAHRVLLGNARRIGGKEIQQNHKEKERGWNIGTAGKTLI